MNIDNINLNINNNLISKIDIYDDYSIHLTHNSNQYNDIISSYSSIFIFTQDSCSIHLSSADNNDLIKTFILKDKESCKSIDQLKEIFDFLTLNKCNKDSLIIGFGGGTVLDVVGFVASIYMRGIDHVFFPTTLLSMVDAAIGGKTAINYNNIRNLIGSINHPKHIIIILEHLKSLPKEELLNGFAEIVKYALIRDENLFNELENNIEDLYPKYGGFDDVDINIKALEHIIVQCIKHKVHIVSQDEHDIGLRKILNFGHTVGHAIESCSNYNISHGLGVFYGMKVAAHISLELNKINEDSYNRIISLIDYFNCPKIDNLNFEKIITFLLHDKKIIGDKINYIILDNIGAASIIEDLNIEIIRNSLKVL